ncbi:LBF_2804 family protein [Spirosoma gilvum]
MSTRPPNNSTGPLDHLSLRYLRQALDMSHPSDEPFVFNPIEQRVIRRAKLATLVMATLLGIFGGLLLYVPQYTWPDLFSTTTVWLFGNSYELPLITALYSILLVYLEINLLLAINRWGVKTIMEICQFPRAHDAQYERHLQALEKAAFEKSQPGFLRFGIDPYLTMPRWGLTLFFLLNVVKASLTALGLRLILQPFIGSYALDLIGLPVYALWNAWASWQVLHETQIRVMAPTTIREFVHELFEEWGKNDQFRPLIMEALQFIFVLDRPYNYAHFLLTETVKDRFELTNDMGVSNQFTEQIQKIPSAVHHSLERLIVFGALIDGHLSRAEKGRIRQLRKSGFMSYSVKEIQQMSTDYNQGRGLWV